MFLGKDQLLKKGKLKVEKIFLTDVDFVYVREYTAREKDDYLLSLIPEGEDGPRNMKNFRARMVVNALCDKSGKRMLEDGDVETLSDSMSGLNMEKISLAVSRMNKLRPQDQEETVKNSEAAQSGNSSSDSVES